MPPRSGPPPPAPRPPQRGLAGPAAIEGSRRARDTGTGAYRPWRNEPTVLIPAVTDAKAARAGASDEPANTRLQEKRHRRDRRTLRLAKATALALTALVFLTAGGAWGMKVWFNSKFTEVAALDEHSADIKDAPAQLGDENFLILGSDTRAGAAREEGVGDENSIGGARSDTLMIAHVPKNRERAVLLSFPRDLEVTRPACNRWDAKTSEYSDEVVPEAERVKLNTAFAVGGPQCVIRLMQKMTGIRMNHFVGIDFHGFKGMVDAVGGVTVNVDGPIVDAKVGTVATQAGPLRLGGKKALRFVRARYVQGDPTSDYGRIKRQQQFISALLTKTMSREVLLNAGKLTDFVNAFAASTFGDNIGVDQLLMLAQSMKGLDTGSIQFLTVPTTGEANEIGNEVLLEEQSSELFTALINGNPVPGSDEETPKAQGADESEPAGAP